MTENRNYNDTQPYVVGILSPSTTLYIDPIPGLHREVSPPTDLELRRRNTNNSFQITSVTVQGSSSRKNDEYDSADDLDESHTDDLSSDFLDSSSRADGYHSEDIAEDLSPCGPIIFAHLPSRHHDPNANNLGVTAAVVGTAMAAGGVTMMTSKSESPVSAQVPIMNPLPDNWQRRFKVVKIVSSEPFHRGRWLCMDFKDPPPGIDEGNGTSTPPTIQITRCGDDEPFARLYEIPTFNGNFVMGDEQQMYGILLPQNEHLQPVTLVQDMSLQTTGFMDDNFNHLVGLQPFHFYSPPASPTPPPTSANNINNNNFFNNVPPPAAVLPNHVLNHHSTGRDSPDITAARTTGSGTSTSSDENRVVGGTVIRASPRPVDADGQSSESGSTQTSEVLQASGVPKPTSASNYVTDGLCCSPPVVQSRNLPPSLPIKPVIVAPQTVAGSNALSSVIVPPIAPTLADINSSQTAPEKVPPSEVGHEVDPSAGSAASTGGNTVAIDNKIEQAMDLVKSHLMFAVREEVEVLKEKITELLERISQLEHENDILRANASAETLKQLSNQSQKKNTGGGNPGKPQPVATVPPST